MNDAAAPPFADGDIPRPPKNRRVKCHGRSVIRYERDTKVGDVTFRRGDPILDADYARQYRPCEAWAANGTEYCGNHGGSAPQTINKAKRTLSLGAEDYAEALRRIATDERVPPDVRIKAINSALDRIGIRTGAELSVEMPKWQKMLGDLFGAEASEDEDEAKPAQKLADLFAPETQAAAKPKTKKAKPSTKPAAASTKFEGWE